MKLYIGGACQGKWKVACQENQLKEEDSCICESCEKEEVFKAPLLYGFHNYVKRFLFTKEEGTYFVERLLSENPSVVVVCNEIGCGVVPIEKREREYRELTGRILTELAKESEQVVRVFCGIGARLK